MDIKVYQTVTEKDGTISAYLTFTDEMSGKLLDRTCIQGRTQEDFEYKINLIKTKLESMVVSKNEEKSLVEKAIIAVKLQETK